MEVMTFSMRGLIEAKCGPWTQHDIIVASLRFNLDPAKLRSALVSSGKALPAGGAVDLDAARLRRDWARHLERNF